MGIQGLLGSLHGLMRDVHIQDFKGKKAAVDGYCWLHKAVYGCCEELCGGNDTKAWIPYCLGMIDMLLYHDITVVLVFDGAKLPSKDFVEQQRSNNRQKNLDIANEFKLVGNYKSAKTHYARAVDVTPLMAAELIKILKTTRPTVSCIVAPYEADAQLAYLSATGFVDVVISEDSDCIPYGCREIIFKLNGSGFCSALLLSDVFSLANDGFDLRCFTMEMVIALCVAAGCDYIKSVPGVGIKNSYKLISQCRSSSSLLRTMRLKGLIPLELHQVASSEKINNRVCTHSRVLQYEYEFCKVSIICLLHLIEVPG
jgi:exonuclease-1